ncbi:AAA family ATPase, partial [Psychromonas aquimarina]|uniref:AAA family ATPase n=1 Tax=Psychromonas aquimarina TaxID=444919 RepID=UPI00055F697B
MTCKVILVGYEKGGVGKTATAINIATALAKERYKGKTDRILIVDADKQATLYRWNQRREENDDTEAFPCICLLLKINKEVNRQRENYDYIIIDA